MRAPALVASTLIALLCVAAEASAGEWTLADWMQGESAWVGHGVGSSYTERQTMTMPKMPDMPDMPNVPGLPRGGTTTTDVKKTLTQVTDTEYVIRVETTVGGRTMTSEEREPRRRTSKATVTDGGEGTVEVEGASYTCALKKVSDFSDLVADSMKPPGGRGGRGGRSMGMPGGPATIWEHPELGVLKVEATMDMMGQSNTMTWVVTKLKVEVRVGERTFTCREMTMTHSMMPGSTMVMLSSRVFPGGSLKYESAMNMMGMQTTTKREVTAYDKKPVAVTSGG